MMASFSNMLWTRTLHVARCRHIGSRFSGAFGVSSLHTSSHLFAHDAEFAQAKERLNTLKEDPGNLTKLQIYALFKQATTGKCNVKKPGMMDFVGKAKWEAWNSLGDMSQ